jgi:hypothetical protein
VSGLFTRRGIKLLWEPLDCIPAGVVPGCVMQ